MKFYPRDNHLSRIIAAVLFSAGVVWAVLAIFVFFEFQLRYALHPRGAQLIAPFLFWGIDLAIWIGWGLTWWKKLSMSLQHANWILSIVFHTPLLLLAVVGLFVPVLWRSYFFIFPLWFSIALAGSIGALIERRKPLHGISSSTNRQPIDV